MGMIVAPPSAGTGLTLSDTAPTTQAHSDSAAAGSGTQPSRDDHGHGMPALPDRKVLVWASAMLSPSSNGAADGETDGTNVIYKTKDYDTTTQEHADFSYLMPDTYTGGDITWRAYWTAAAGSGGETIAWEINILALANDEVIDAAFTDIGSITDTLIATGDLHIASLTQSANKPVAGDYVMVRVSRDVAADNLSGDVKLIAIVIEFPEA